MAQMGIVANFLHHYAVNVQLNVITTFGNPFIKKDLASSFNSSAPVLY